MVQLPSEATAPPQTVSCWLCLAAIVGELHSLVRLVFSLLSHFVEILRDVGHGAVWERCVIVTADLQFRTAALHSDIIRVHDTER